MTVNLWEWEKLTAIAGTIVVIQQFCRCNLTTVYGLSVDGAHKTVR